MFRFADDQAPEPDATKVEGLILEHLVWNREEGKHVSVNVDELAHELDHVGDTRAANERLIASGLVEYDSKTKVRPTPMAIRYWELSRYFV